MIIDESRPVTRPANITAKSDEQKKAEAVIDAFRQDLGPFVVAAQKTRMAMIFTDVDPGHSIIFANDAFLQLTGYGRDEVLAKGFQSLFAEGFDAESGTSIETAFRGESDREPEIYYRRKDGSQFWASVYVSPVCDQGGAIVQHFVSLIDLTSHRQEAARSKMLIDELNHRVKNMLATVQSIVQQALRRPAEASVIREAIESRIMALSNSHDLLSNVNWSGAGLHDLVDTALQPFEVLAGLAERFTVQGANVHLSPKVTLSLAIALHELATNAVKYGAFSNEAGTIAIDWALETASSGSRLVLRWQERGGPPVIEPSMKGFGSWVIQRGLAHELNAVVDLQFKAGGLECIIDIPALERSE